MFISKSQQLNSTGGDLLGSSLMASPLPASAFLQGWGWPFHGVSPWPGRASKKRSQLGSAAEAITPMADKMLPEPPEFTQSLPLFPCSFRLVKLLKSSAGSPETLKSDFAKQEPAPLSLIRKYPVPGRETGTAVAPAAVALPCRVARVREEAHGCTNVSLCQLLWTELPLE